MSDKDADEKTQEMIQKAIDRWADKRLSEFGKWSLITIGIAFLYLLMHAFVAAEKITK